MLRSSMDFILTSSEAYLLIQFEQNPSLEALANTLHRDPTAISRQLKRISEKGDFLVKASGRWRITQSGMRINQATKDYILSQNKVLDKKIHLKIGVTMKTINLVKTASILIFVLILSSNVFAQDKPAKADECCTTTAKHVCTDECKTAGCDVVKAKEAKACADVVKHVCTDECKTAGCDVVKAKEAKRSVDAKKHVCTDECKTAGCDVVKAKEAKASLDVNKHVCTDECKTAGCSDS